MGVQKSRKSIKFSKFSLSLKLKKNINEYLTVNKINNIYKKNKYKKTNIFFLKKLENDKPVFF